MTREPGVAGVAEAPDAELEPVDAIAEEPRRPADQVLVEVKDITDDPAVAGERLHDVVSNAVVVGVQIPLDDRPCPVPVGVGGIGPGYRHAKDGRESAGAE